MDNTDRLSNGTQFLLQSQLQKTLPFNNYSYAITMYFITKY